MNEVQPKRPPVASIDSQAAASTGRTDQPETIKSSAKKRLRHSFAEAFLAKTWAFDAFFKSNIGEEFLLY